jgi:glycosyltransferase involved in cell wall biosynthesis
MQRKKILWLVSWYPNRNDSFDGDFIQRHARAAAICHDVHVIFVTDATMEKEIDEEWNYVTGLTEQIIYFKKKQGIAARLRKQLTWKTLYQEAVKKYIGKNGLPDCVHVHVPWKAGLIALWMKRKYGKDFVVTEHWGFYNDVVDDNFYTKSKLTQALLKKLFNEAKSFISVSNFLGKCVERVAHRKADMIIRNVVDTTLFFYKVEKHSRFTFIHVSSMVPLKNVKPIIDAFKIISETEPGNFQLILIGNRDNEYPKYAEQFGLLNTSVFFRAEIPYKEVAEEMRRSHCFILNSFIENSPCVIGEALCCGLPVIATDVGGVAELIDETNSRLIPSNDNQALVEAMENVYSEYSSFNRKQFSEEASKIFSYSAISQKFDELYRDFC